MLELRQRFGAVSTESQIIRGIWEREEQVYRDELTRLFVDVADLPENLEFFRKLKERLKFRFVQIDIWMTTYPLEVL